MGDASFLQWDIAGLVRDPLNVTVEPRAGVLTFCRNINEACYLAAGSTPPGTAVVLIEQDGHETATIGSTGPFGPLVKVFHSPDQEMIDSLVLDTLKGGSDQDVWLYASDPEDREWFTDVALSKGHRVVEADGAVPPSCDRPFSLFGAASGRVTPGEDLVLAYARIDTAQRDAVPMGAVLHMENVSSAEGETIFFADDKGVRAGMLGIMPKALTEKEVAAIRSVSSVAEGESYGLELRGGREVMIQTVQMRIPAAVDMILAAARLPAEECASGIKRDYRGRPQWSMQTSTP